jgi:outer membrane protein assembly factor BamB
VSSKALAPHATRYDWGTAASPVLYHDRLYLVNDNEDQSYLLALDKRTGGEVWRVDRDEKSNWSTPAMVGDRLLIRTSTRINCIRKGVLHE